MAQSNSSASNLALPSQPQSQLPPQPLSMRAHLEGIQTLFMQQRLENKTLREKLVLAMNENKALHAQVQTLLTTKEKVADLERRHAEMLSEVYRDQPLVSGPPQSAQHISVPSQPIPNGTAGSAQSLVVGTQSTQSVANEPVIAWRDIVLHHIHNFEERPDVERLLSSKVAQFAAMHAIKREQPPQYSRIKSNVTAIPHSLIPQFIKHLGLPPLPAKQSAQAGTSSNAIPVKPVAQQKSVLPQPTPQSNGRFMPMEPVANLADGSKNIDRCYAWTDILAVARSLYPTFDTSASKLQARLHNFQKRTGLQNIRVPGLFQQGNVVVGIPERFIADFVEEMTRPSRPGENTFPRVGSSESVAAAQSAVQEAVLAAMVGTAGSITAPITQEILERGVKRQRVEDNSSNGQSFPAASVSIRSKESHGNISSESLFSNINSEAIAPEMDLNEASKMNVDEVASAVEATSVRPMTVVRDIAVPVEQNPEPSAFSSTVPATIPTVPKLVISLSKSVTPKSQNSALPAILPGHPASSRSSPIPISVATGVTSDSSKTASPFAAAPTVALGSSMSTPSMQKAQSLSASTPSIALTSNSSTLSKAAEKTSASALTEESLVLAPKVSTPIVASQPASLQLATAISSNPSISLNQKSATTFSTVASASFALPISTSKLGSPRALQASALASKPGHAAQPAAKQAVGSDSDSKAKELLDGRGKDSSVPSAKPVEPVEGPANQKDTGILQTTGIKEDHDIHDAMKSLFDNEEIALMPAGTMKAKGKEQGNRDSFGSTLKRDRDRIDSPTSATVSETSTMEVRMNGDVKQDILDPRRNSNGSTPPIADDLGDLALNQPVESYQQNDGVLYNVLLRKMMDFDQIALELRHAVKMAVKDFLLEAMPEMGSTLKACEVHLSPGVPGKEDQVTYLVPAAYVAEFCEWIYEELVRVFPGRSIQKIPEMADYA
ncbi:hypothetical protein HDU80_002922 [Chytriomyces hyalinus]|nr:hypothetical protein HDU80_002922 [Chytriomyces hyalinus]